ncbi:rCG39300 [Rattus norvegicus]|uniref:RCG39300 n=1 Tax=Rattus norvegicus TaxID=10116 RepID=A6I7R0_RAT|nr:rCG39300 [Rattus norvegicus]
MFANKVPQENYQTLSTVQGLVIKLPLFTELFQDSFGEVVASHAVMSLSGSPPTGKNLKIRTSS